MCNSGGNYGCQEIDGSLKTINKMEHQDSLEEYLGVLSDKEYDRICQNFERDQMVTFRG